MSHGRVLLREGVKESCVFGRPPLCYEEQRGSGQRQRNYYFLLRTAIPGPPSLPKEGP